MKLKQFLLLLLALASVSWHVQGQVVRYQSADSPKLYTAAEVDTFAQIMNRRYRKAGVEFTRRIKSTSTRGDTTIYTYTLLGTPSREAVAAREKQLLAFVGKPVPVFTLPDLAGRQVASKNLLGKPVIINLWFTTCSPCIAEMPVLKRIQAEKAQAGVVFLAVTYQSREDVQAFLKKHAFTFRHLVGAETYL